MRTNQTGNAPSQTRAAAEAPRMTLLGAGLGLRLAMAAGAIAPLWLAVFWALAK